MHIFLSKPIDSLLWSSRSWCVWISIAPVHVCVPSYEADYCILKDPYSWIKAAIPVITVLFYWCKIYVCDLYQKTNAIKWLFIFTCKLFCVCELCKSSAGGCIALICITPNLTRTPRSTYPAHTRLAACMYLHHHTTWANGRPNVCMSRKLLHI